MNYILNYSRLVCYVGRKRTPRFLVRLKMSRNVQNMSWLETFYTIRHLSGICYVGKETKILGDAEDVLEEEDAEISFPGSLVSDCLPVLHENFSTFSQTKKKIYSIVVICYSIERRSSSLVIILHVIPLQLMPKSYSTIKLAMIIYYPYSTYLLMKRIYLYLWRE